MLDESYKPKKGDFLVERADCSVVEITLMADVPELPAQLEAYRRVC